MKENKTNAEQKLVLHKVVWTRRDTLEGMDNCVNDCDNCGRYCATGNTGDQQTGFNLVHANVYRIMNGMA